MREATVRAACRLASGHEVAAVAPAAVAVLTQGVLSMTNIGRLKIAAACVLATAAVFVAFTGVGCRAIAARRQTLSSPVRIKAVQAAAHVANPPTAHVGPWIRGVVVDTYGNPVSDARVSSLWTIKAPFATTKADGTFTLPNEETRLLNLSFLATANDGAFQGIFRFDDLKNWPRMRPLVRIVLKPARIVMVRSSTLMRSRWKRGCRRPRRGLSGCRGPH